MISAAVSGGAKTEGESRLNSRITSPGRSLSRPFARNILAHRESFSTLRRTIRPFPGNATRGGQELCPKFSGTGFQPVHKTAGKMPFLRIPNRDTTQSKKLQLVVETGPERTILPRAVRRLSMPSLRRPPSESLLEGVTGRYTALLQPAPHRRNPVVSFRCNCRPRGLTWRSSLLPDQSRLCLFRNIIRGAAPRRPPRTTPVRQTQPLQAQALTPPQVRFAESLVLQIPHPPQPRPGRHERTCQARADPLSPPASPVPS